MDASSLLADISAFYIQEIGALLFGLVFFFLWRQSRVVYFGLWALAWGLRIVAAFFGFELTHSSHNVFWLAPYATFEFGFAILVVAAARAGFGSGMRDWRTVLRLIAILPIFVALVFAIGQYSGMGAYDATQALLLGFVYLYAFLLLRHQGLGARIFRFSLVVLAAAFFQHAGILLYVYHSRQAAAWALFLHRETYYEFILHCVMAFAAMAMWSEMQLDRIRDITSELEQVRRENLRGLDLDHLTGLLNQSALARRVEQPATFEGVVTVCDMDNFKDINDRFGHLVGDEILRNIGHLLQSSIRQEDEAYRWGGDEFVILFQDQQVEVAGKRMLELEARLREFRVRGFGVIPISFSWGVSDSRNRQLREALDEADRSMYEHKRTRANTNARQPT